LSNEMWGWKNIRQNRLLSEMQNGFKKEGNEKRKI